MGATTRWLLDTLDANGVRATFFVLGWIAEEHPQLVADIRGAGHDIGSHGHEHVRAYELGNDAFAADLQKSISALRSAGVPPVTAFRAPEWSINDGSLWALDTLARSGFTTDASMAPVKIVGSTRYSRLPHVRQTASGPITEVPPLVVDRFGQVMPLGWGWGLRMSSPRRILRRIEEVNRAGSPAVLAVHPWEFDVDPPKVRLPASLHFAHYFRLDGFRDRLRSILAGAQFGPITSLRCSNSAQS
ncbi:MAG TPA: polysaccharide deacetylase family protein [Vicinamibacterales bacterium]|nr:polysaccharide deacetylase family protein [Vicinamibacterales bacterium]